MNVMRHDLYFWQVVHHLVVEEGYRVLDMEQSEVWLESDALKDRTVIRIKRIDVDWGNQLRADFEQVRKKMLWLKRQLGVRRLRGEAIYVTMYPPVDDWSSFEAEEKLDRNGNVTLRPTLIVAEESERKATIAAVNERLSIHLPHVALLDEDGYQMEQMARYLRQQIRHTANATQQKERRLFQYGKPYATYGLLVIIAFMYVLLEMNGGSTDMPTLIEFGAKYNPAIADGEWWRLLSSMFLHIGILHFMMNSLALFYLGGTVERIYGTSRFFIIYFIAGLAGSIASFALNAHVSAGASGAIFGCFGALLYFGTVHKKLFFRTMGSSVLLILVFNLAFGFIIPMIDNGAHIGGLIGGFLASAVVHLPNHRPRLRQLSFLLLTVLALIGSFAFGFVNEHKAGADLLALQNAQDLIEAEDIEAAYEVLLESVEKGNERAEAYFLLSYTEAVLGKYEEAEEHLQKTIDLEPKMHEAHYNLALVYDELDERQKALESAQEAVRLDPGNEKYETFLRSLEE